MKINFKNFVAAALALSTPLAAQASDGKTVLPAETVQSSSTFSFGDIIGDATGFNGKEAGVIKHKVHGRLYDAAVHTRAAIATINQKGEVISQDVVIQSGLLVDTQRLVITPTQAFVLQSRSAFLNTADVTIGAGVATGGMLFGLGEYDEGKAAKERNAHSTTVNNNDVTRIGTEVNDKNNLTGDTITKVDNTATGNGKIEANGNVGFGQNQNGQNTSLSGNANQTVGGTSGGGNTNNGSNGTQDALTRSLMGAPTAPLPTLGL